MCASQWVSIKPRGATKAKVGGPPNESGSRSFGGGRTDDPSSARSTLGRSESAHVGTRKMVNYAQAG